MGWQDRAYNRDDPSGIPPVRFTLPQISPLVMTLLCVNFGLFLLKFSPQIDRLQIEWGSLSLASPARWWQVWRLITYQYIHGGVGHVFFNMLGVFFFVPTLERRWGWQKTFAFYTLGGVVAGFCFLTLALMTTPLAYLIGASGSVFAMLGAVALMYPEQQLILLFFSVPIRAAAAIFGLWFLLSTFGERSFSDAAHLGGLVFGFCAPWIIGPFIADKQRQLKQWQGDRARNAEIAEQQEIDRILTKVGESGMNSLSGREKKALAQASENQRKRDKARRR